MTNGVKVTGPKKITKMGMYRYCWPGCLTVMYDAEKIGKIQIADIKKNNDLCHVAESNQKRQTVIIMIKCWHSIENGQDQYLIMAI